MAAGVYAIACLVNGWQYIGHTENLDKKWKVHRRKLETGTHQCKQLQTDWDKWGASKFFWVVLEVVPLEDSNQMPLWLRLSFREADHQEERYKLRSSHEYNTTERECQRLSRSI